jgi:hypothetical protein
MAIDKTQDESGETGTDLQSALAGDGDTGFVVETPKKVSQGTIVLAGVLLACGGGTYLMHLHSGPKEKPPAPETVAATTTINQYLSSGGDNVKQMKELLQSTEKVVQQFLAYPGKAQIPIERLQTNPFRFLKPNKAQEEAQAAEAKVDQERLRAQAKAAAMKAAEALHLQSIIHGRQKGCLINNTLYAEGQAVNGFTVQTIKPQAVVVSQGDMMFELTMEK